MTDDERRRRIQRQVADTVLADDTMFTTPVRLLSNVQVELLQAALVGPYGDEIVARMDAARTEP